MFNEILEIHQKFIPNNDIRKIVRNCFACIVSSFAVIDKDLRTKNKVKNIVRYRARVHTNTKFRNRFATAVAECADRINLFLEQHGR